MMQIYCYGFTLQVDYQLFDWLRMRLPATFQFLYRLSSLSYSMFIYRASTQVDYQLCPPFWSYSSLFHLIVDYRVFIFFLLPVAGFTLQVDYQLQIFPVPFFHFQVSILIGRLSTPMVRIIVELVVWANLRASQQCCKGNKRHQVVSFILIVTINNEAEGERSRAGFQFLQETINLLN